MDARTLSAALTSALAATSLTTTSQCPFKDEVMREVILSCSFNVQHSTDWQERRQAANDVCRAAAVRSESKLFFSVYTLNPFPSFINLNLQAADESLAC